MNQSSNIGNKQYEKRRSSSPSIDQNSHSIINGTVLSLQSFVDDIPFQFNPKYQTIFVSNVDIPEYDTNKIRDILSKSIDFTLENNVLLEALEDLKRKKKQIESDTLRQQFASSNCQSSNIVSVNPFPIGGSIPVNNPTPPSSFRLPSVRDIYWPSINQEEYLIPSTQSSSDLVKQTNHSFNNCNNDLAYAFDETLTSDDPFHNAELKSLNDVKELNHLYSDIGLTNTIRR